jgi:DNA-directed RNA polymerase specialized sigma24 family protein
LIPRLEEEYRRKLLDRAMARVRTRVEPRTWAAVRLTRLVGFSGVSVADRLEMKLTRVDTARSEAQKMIRARIRMQEEIE